MIDIFLEAISDGGTREAVQKLVRTIAEYPWLKGKWDFLEVSLNVGDNTINHTLGIKPRDIILLSQTGTSTISFKYSEFTKTTLKINSTTKTTARLFYGEYTR